MSGQGETLELQALAVARGARPLFQPLSLKLSGGQALHLAGPNGSGKTSLLRVLAGLSPPHQGRLLWRGRPLSAQTEAWREGLLYLGHAPALKDDLLAWENLAMTANLSGQSQARPVDREQAVRALACIGLARQAGLPARALSQGQRKRIGLARLFLAAPRVLLLDEPFDALDEAGLAALRARLSALVQGGALAIYTTHQDQALELPAPALRQLRLQPSLASRPLAHDGDDDEEQRLAA